MRALVAYACGALFALGLGLGGMTQPSKVIGFLDVAGHWDPTLMFVMAGAVGVSLLLFPRVLHRVAPIFGGRFALPERRDIDAPLLVGAALFGVGWGLSGYCPGPAVVSVVTGSAPVLVFSAAMVTGLALGGWRRRT